MRASSAQPHSIRGWWPVEARSRPSWFRAYASSVFHWLLAALGYASVAIYIFTLIGLPLLLTIFILA